VAGVPTDGSNIAVRAARLLAEHAGVDRRVRIEIDKGIPVMGGMAGGSADAAAALLACHTLWDLPGPREELVELAAELGSDVPFALHGGTALGEGHGEVVTPLTDEGSWWWVVVPSDEGMSTPAVYRHYDEVRPDAPLVPDPPDEILAAVVGRDPRRLAAALHNDLEEAACELRPELARLIAEGVDAGALRGLVSGSGPTCVFLCESADHARSVAGVLQATDDRRVVLVAHGPVAGAHVVAGE
jgi:4-diphosphocytidyl-2-C-methyl-D-erythritol kinase